MMKKYLLSVLLLLALIPFYAQRTTDTHTNYSFYENKGQIVNQDGNVRSDVKYLFVSSGLNVQLKQTGFSYDIYESDRKAQKSPILDEEKPSDTPLDYLYHRIDIEFENADRNPLVVAEGKSPDFSNYFNIPGLENGVEKVHRYQKIIYKNIYPKIDVVFFKPDDSEKTVEYNFVVHPGGKISDIRLKFRGASAVIKELKLTMQVRFGELQEEVPASWIVDSGTRKTIPVRFKHLGDQVFGFDSETESSDKTIIIDPVPTRIWGSYLGGSGDEGGHLKTDSLNNPYIFGTTSSTTNMATSGAYQQSIAGSYDAFVTKLNPDGQRYWATYYGLQFRDEFTGVDFDSAFNIYLIGNTRLPMPGYNSPLYVYPQNVVLKLDSNGSLIFQKVFGGNGEDIANDIAFFNQALYVVGNTFSDSGLATPGAFQTTKATPAGFTDGFVTKLESGAGNIVWSTYVGGNASSDLYQVFSTSAGIEISGATRATNLVMVNPFQGTHAGNTDGLYLNFSEAGTLTKSSYIGTANPDVPAHARRINNILIFSGYQQFPVRGISFRVDLNTNTIAHFIYDFIASGQIDSYSDAAGNIFFSGLAGVNAAGIATPNAYMMSTGPYIKTFMIKYDQNNQKIWGTFYGGNGGTQQGRITKDSADYIYFTGMSSNNTTGIATPGTFQQSGGHPSNDMFIAKFKDCSSVGVTSNSPVCPGADLLLSAPHATTYAWTGPNGFTSTIQNPVITNATPMHSGTYHCVVTGTGDCDGPFSVVVLVADNTPPVPTMTTLPTITGNCQVTVSNIPTAADFCTGLVNATTTSPLSYAVPGNYSIQWTYSDGNGNSITQNQAIVVTATAPPTVSSPQVFCQGNLPKIQDITISGTGIKWYDAAGNLLPSTTLLIHGVTYYASQTVNGCESNQTAVLIQLNSTAIPTGAATQIFCPSQNATVAHLTVIGQNIIWYNASGTVLAPTTPLVNGQSYYASQTINGCISHELLQVNAVISTEVIPAADYMSAICNPTLSSTHGVNLSDYNANIIANPGLYTFEYFSNTIQPVTNFQNVTLNLGANTFYVTVSNSSGCSKTVALTLILNPKPLVNLPQNASFCVGQNLTLDAGAGFTSYLWSNGATTQTISVSLPGTYSVTVQNSSGCSGTASTTVTSINSGMITGVRIENQTATVMVDPTGTYLYSLDNLNWQNSNTFYGLNNGLYTVYVKTETGCIVGSYDFAIFSITNAITPNGDGINDTWIIAGLEKYRNSEIVVYDRYGLEVFKKIVNGTFVWDGMVKAGPLPSNSYWYTLKVSDGRLFTGYLLIKNRD